MINVFKSDPGLVAFKFLELLFIQLEATFYYLAFGIQCQRFECSDKEKNFSTKFMITSWANNVRRFEK